jgi:ammonium transporter, Amt family
MNTSDSTTTNDGSIFQTCVEQNPGSNTTVLLQCVSDSYQTSQESDSASLHSFLLVLAGAMIFFMQTGFAMLCAGSVRLKNVQNTMLKNLLDACGAALAFYVVGTS